MADFRINTEVHKREREVVLYMTQGEATQVPYEVYVLNNQEPLDLTGTIVEYRATLPNGTFLNQLISTNDIDSKKGKINWLPDSRLTQAHGKITVSQFVITKGDRNIRTRDIVIDVTSTPDMTDKAAEVIMTQIDELKESVIEIDNEVTVVGDKVNEIKDEITNHPDKFRGLKGDKGDPGVQGLKGDQGDQGVQGLKGDNGDVSLVQFEEFKDKLDNFVSPMGGEFKSAQDWIFPKYQISANIVTMYFDMGVNVTFDEGVIDVGVLPPEVPKPLRVERVVIGSITKQSPWTGVLSIYTDGTMKVDFDNGKVDKSYWWGSGAVTYFTNRTIDSAYADMLAKKNE